MTALPLQRVLEGVVRRRPEVPCVCSPQGNAGQPLYPVPGDQNQVSSGEDAETSYVGGKLMNDRKF